MYREWLSQTAVASGGAQQSPAVGKAAPAPPKAPPPRHLLTNGLTKATEKAAILALISKFGRNNNLQQSTMDALKKLPEEAVEKIIAEMPVGLTNADAFVRGCVRDAALAAENYALAVSLTNSKVLPPPAPPPADPMEGDTMTVRLGPLGKPATIPAVSLVRGASDEGASVRIGSNKVGAQRIHTASRDAPEESRWTCLTCSEVNNKSRLQCNNCGRERVLEANGKPLDREIEAPTKKQTKWNDDHVASAPSRTPGNLRPLTPADAPDSIDGCNGPRHPSSSSSGPPPWAAVPPLPHMFGPHAWAMFGQMAFANLSAKKTKKDKKQEKKRKRKRPKGRKRSRTRSDISSSSSSSVSRSFSSPKLGKGVGKARCSKGKPHVEEAAPPAVSSKAQSTPPTRLHSNARAPPLVRPEHISNEDISQRDISDWSPLREASPVQTRIPAGVSDQSPPSDFWKSQISTPVSFRSDATRPPMPDASRTQNESSSGVWAEHPKTDKDVKAPDVANHASNGGGAEWPAGSQEQKLHEWLNQLDGGRGVLLQYFDTLRREFSSDMSRIREMRLATPRSAGILGTIDAYFWELCGIRQMGHRLLLAKGINALE